MKRPQITALDGSTFVVSETTGDIGDDGGEVLGLFFRDVRHLSRWELTVDDEPLDVLSVGNVDYDTAEFFLAVPTGTIYRNPTLSVRRHREIGNGMTERLVIENDGVATARCDVALRFGSDFADIFEIKDHLGKQGQVHRRVEGSTAVLRYVRDGFSRETRIHAPGADITTDTISFHLELTSHEQWTTDIEVRMVTGGEAHEPKRQRRRPNMEQSLDEWLDEAPRLASEWDTLGHTYHRSVVDLAALRFYPNATPTASLPAAGLPWFMALFGRDAIIASYQALPFFPELARTTLHALASLQADRDDDFRDAEPGKILHELRHGELVAFHERPQSPYYGAADTTPLFLVLLDEYERWTGDTATVTSLEPTARAAIAWMDDHGDLDGDGYVEYQTRNPATGLVNQCWKDSGNSIVHPDGTLAQLPRATCEIQGYVYDARRRSARLARSFWDDTTLADRLDEQARRLKDRFNTDFWVDAGRFYALALDGRKHRVATLSSNIGHLLWSGIVADDRIDDVARHLLGDRLHSGWGVRTLAAGQPAYNPIGYHNGTVWPHDNAIIAHGLARSGHREEASSLARTILEAAPAFEYRLPEAFAGFDRRTTAFPVGYPTACSPQAWAAGAPLLLLRVLLGLEPDDDRLRVDPCVPPELGALTLSKIPGRWGASSGSTAGPLPA